jgi:galactose mutarotase-like enzyme
VTHGVRREPGSDGHDRVVLVSDDGVEAAFLPTVGMVCVSLTLDGVELLATRHGVAGYLQRGSTFGIPLLAPWANRLAAVHQQVGDLAWDVRPGDPGVHADQWGQAIHGLVPGAGGWTEPDIGARDGSAYLSAAWTFDDSSDRFRSFPFPFRLYVDVTLTGRILRFATGLEPTSELAVPVAFGWHPWFEFPDVPRGEWVLQTPFVRRAVLSDQAIPTGEVVDDQPPSGPLGSAFLDDVFLDVADGAEVGVRAGPRGVTVRYVSGFPVGVVFAPLDADVVCVEPMTAPTDPFAGRFPLRLAQPGERFDTVFEVVAERH